MPLLLHLSTLLIGFIVLINGAYLSTEISAIASTRGLQPWLLAARKRRKHYGFLRTIMHFPSEVLRVIHDRFFQPHQLSKKAAPSDETLLEATCNIFSALGLLMMVHSLIFIISVIDSSSSLSNHLIILQLLHQQVGCCLYFACWFFFTIISEPAQLFFPWHCLLGESLFLLFLGHLSSFAALSSLSTSSTNNTCYIISEWLLRFLLVRLMWGFSKTKFLASDWGDRYYLLPFLRSMPIPSPIGIMAARFLEKHLFPENCPDLMSSLRQVGSTGNERLFSRFIRAVLVASYGFFFFAEVISPFFILFFSRENWFWLKLIAGPPAVALLMTGIQITGNFGFFPLLTATLCFPAFGSSYSSSELSSSPNHETSSFTDLFFSFSSSSSLLSFLYLPHTIYSVMSFPMISWFAFGWTNNFVGFLNQHLLGDQKRKKTSRGTFMMKTIVIEYFVSPVMTTFSCWRISHPYGIFPPHTFPGARLGQLYEWSIDDGKTWNTYRYKYQLFSDDNDHRENNNSSSSKRLFGLSSLFGSFVPFIHPHLDWASFYPFGFSGGNSMINGVYFNNICPFRNYDVRLPVRVAHCLIEGADAGTRVTDFFDQSSLPPKNDTSNSTNHLAVRSRAVFHAAPWTVCLIDQQKHGKNIKPVHCHHSHNNKKADDEIETPLWYQIDGPMFVPFLTQEIKQKLIPEFVSNPVREIEFIHPEYAFTWRKWLGKNNDDAVKLFSERANITMKDGIERLMGKASSSSSAAKDFILEFRQQQFINGGQSDEEVKNLTLLCRSFMNQAVMFVEQQKFCPKTWFGKDIVAVGCDMYKFALQTFGKEEFDRLTSKILALAHLVDSIAEKMFVEGADQHDEDSSFFFESKCSSFLRHLSCLVFVVTFLSRNINEEDTFSSRVVVEEVDDDENDNDEQKFEESSSKEEILINSLIRQLFSSSSKKEKSSSLPSLLGRILSELTINGRGPCSSTSSTSSSSSSSSSSETFSTIVAVTCFVAFRAPSIRQEASALRCLDSMSLVGIDPDSDFAEVDEESILSKAVGQKGYFWFFTRWIFEGMPWEQDDFDSHRFLKEQQEVDSSRNRNEDAEACDGKIQKNINKQQRRRYVFEKNVERAPWYRCVRSEKFGTQHALVMLHEKYDGRLL